MIKHAYNENWRFNVYFFIGHDLKDYIEYLDKNLGFNGLPHDFCGDGHSFTCLKDGAFIWTKKHDVSIIAHECFHSANFLLESIGVKNESVNDEPLAYLLTWMIRNSGFEYYRGNDGEQVQTN